MPIITSLLDIDFYKFTMGQLVFHRYPDVPVRYAFKNRTSKVKIPEFVREEDLRRELDEARKLRFNNSELHYLRGTNEYGGRMFEEDYLEFLRGFELPEYRLEVVDGELVIEVAGRWRETIYWETIILSIVNELYNDALMSRLSRFEQEAIQAEGILRLKRKIKKLRARPKLKFSEFGTRRRFSGEHQDYVVGVLAKEIPEQLLGTSNVLLAMKHGLLPMGTSGHETQMAMSGIMHGSDDEILASHNKVLQDWWDEYGWGLSIALTDTFGTDFFFRDMTGEQARDWKGLRQDSGDPMVFGKKALAFYEGHGVDPKDKLLIFSDGLDVDIMIRIHREFSKTIGVTFGWGTNLTNDVGFAPLSLVVKIVEANGHGTVKLSDNMAKAIGSFEDIERFKRIFGHTDTTFEECKY